MRAVVCRSYGTPDDLVIEDVAAPVPGPGQLLVRVHAAAVNFPDVLLIAGKYQVKIPVPFTPGSELAGEVLAVGEGVRFRPCLLYTSRTSASVRAAPMAGSGTTTKR